MRTVYLTSGDVVAEVGAGKAETSPGVGLMLDAQCQTVGFDMYAEVAPDQWVRADQLPNGLLAEERRRGTLTSGILYAGKLYNRININNLADRLVAAKVGLEKEAERYHSGRATFVAQIGNPLDQLMKRVLALKLKLMEKEVSKTDPANRIAKVKSTVEKLQKDDAAQPKEDDDEPTIEPEQPFDFVKDLQRAYTGRTLTTAELNTVLLGQQIADVIDDGEPSLLGNPEKMASLRQLIAPLGGRSLAQRKEDAKPKGKKPKYRDDF